MRPEIISRSVLYWAEEVTEKKKRKKKTHPQPLRLGEKTHPQPLPCREGSNMPKRLFVFFILKAFYSPPLREGLGGGSPYGRGWGWIILRFV